jgi:hypothetical protein
MFEGRRTVAEQAFVSEAVAPDWEFRTSGLISRYKSVKLLIGQSCCLLEYLKEHGPRELASLSVLI